MTGLLSEAAGDEGTSVAAVEGSGGVVGCVDGTNVAVDAGKGVCLEDDDSMRLEAGLVESTSVSVRA